jgi:hypothetical protein
MQPDLIGTNETKEVDSNTFRQPLQFRARDLFTRKDNVDEHCRIVAPVYADMMIRFASRAGCPHSVFAGDQSGAKFPGWWPIH